MELESTPENKADREQAVHDAYQRNYNGQLPVIKISYIDITSFEETSTPGKDKPQVVKSVGFLLQDYKDGNLRFAQSYGIDHGEMVYRDMVVLPESLIVSSQVIPEINND